MIQEQGRVEGIDGEFALIEAAQSGGCSACGVKSGCPTSKLGKFLQPRARVWRVANDQDLRPGETVTLHLPEAALLSAAAIAYLPPLLGLLAGASAAAALGASDLWAALGAISGFLAGLIASRWLGRRHAARYAPAAVTRNAPPVASVLPIRIFPQGR
ncbi:MAG: SoxR reducing system RseC family protein [Rhodocyclaceae bacterium]